MNNVINKLSELDTPNDPDPNKRFRFVSNTYNFNTTENVHDFCRRFNHDNNYIDNYGIILCVGDNIVINDGRYNETWIIAGFDCEHNRIASDGTTYDNGYGIFLIPKNTINTKMNWTYNKNTMNWSYDKNIGYLNSNIHKYINGPLCDSMKHILKDHLVQRNTLLSNSINKNPNDNYVWTKSYLTLMSTGQLTGDFLHNRIKYDHGEANYKLPLFNFIPFQEPDKIFWTRCICDNDTIWAVYYDGGIVDVGVFEFCSVKPLMCIR